jgi:vacuolar iron transporter family protein
MSTLALSTVPHGKFQQYLRVAVPDISHGILFGSGLIVGVAATGASHEQLVACGIGALALAALTTAARGHVSTHAREESDEAEQQRGRGGTDASPTAEREALSASYSRRGLQPALAAKVAAELMEHDAFGTHTRAELGFSPIHRAAPAASVWTSAASAALGAALPLVVAMQSGGASPMRWVAGASLLVLAALGAADSRAHGCAILPGTLRIILWGVLTMAAMAAVGAQLN